VPEAVVADSPLAAAFSSVERRALASLVENRDSDFLANFIAPGKSPVDFRRQAMSSALRKPLVRGRRKVPQSLFSVGFHWEALSQESWSTLPR